MTLAELMSSPLPSIGTLRLLGLSFGPDLCQRLVNVQAWYGDPRHVPAPRATTDGQWVLCADILTECRPGGIVMGGFSHFDASRFDEIEVVPLADIPFADGVPQLVPEKKP